MQIFSQLCYYIRNRYLADHADTVLAVYDMNANKGSGTGYTVHYAQIQGKDHYSNRPGRFSRQLLQHKDTKYFLTFLKNLATIGDKIVLNR